jgi:hypothetical protein
VLFIAFIDSSSISFLTAYVSDELLVI